MSVENALNILKTYRDGVLDATLIKAIETLVQHVDKLSDEQAQEIRSALWGIAWDRRFIAETPHNEQNPGLIADRHKGKFRCAGTSNDGAMSAVSGFLGGR